MARLETKLLVLLPATSLVFGCLEYGPARGPEAGSALLTLHAVSALALVFAWFWFDSRGRRYRASIVLHLAMISLTVVALPYYLFRSRGLAGGFRTLALAALVFGCSMAAYRVGSMFA